MFKGSDEMFSTQLYSMNDKSQILYAYGVLSTSSMVIIIGVA